jgi:hypothetical protein
MRPWKAQAMIILLLILMVSILGFYKGVETVDGAGGALIIVNPDPGQSELHAKVDPSRGGIVTFTGFVDGKQPVDLDSQYAVVNLVAEIEGWEVTKIPSLVLTRSMNQIHFSVSIMVPPNIQTSGLDVTKIMSISGAWSYEPNGQSGIVDPLEVFVYIDQFYEYRIRAKQPFIQTSPGGEFDIELEITNEGNGDDHVSIGVDRRENMESHGWAFVFETTSWDIPYQKTVIIPVHIATPKRWDGWRNKIVTIKFRLMSEQAVQTNAVAESASYSIFIRQRGVSVPGFEPFMVLIAILLASIFTLYKRRH